jgi:hypothetical protein
MYTEKDIPQQVQGSSTMGKNKWKYVKKCFLTGIE